MPAVCLYLQIHQPFQLRKYTVFDSNPSYFDTDANACLTHDLAQRCYLPAAQLLLELVTQHRGRFRFALSITGTAIELLEAHAPEVLQNLHALANSGGVEFLGETSHHSLASLHSPTEFAQQVQLHRTLIKRLFDQSPTVFHNTELIYSDNIATLAAEQQFTAILAEGYEKNLASRSAAFLYRTQTANLALLLRNHHLSTTLAASPPPSDESFTHAISQIGGQLCNLFLPLEIFDEPRLHLLRTFPKKLLATNNEFLLPSEIAAASSPQHSAGQLSIPNPIPWTQSENDAPTLGPWLGNAMQQNAADELYKLEPAIKHHAAKSPRLLEDWRKLTASDHFHNMSTLTNHTPSPYDSPYDAYINFMNVLDNLRSRTA